MTKAKSLKLFKRVCLGKIMYWYSNKKERIRFIERAHEEVPTLDYIRECYDKYFAVKKSHKDHDIVTCTKCGLEKKIKKNQNNYVCDCGYYHKEIKSIRFKNFEDQFVIRSASNYEGQDIVNDFLVYVSYDSKNKSVNFHKPLLVAKEMYVKEKTKRYFYNLAYYKPLGYGYHEHISYNKDKKTTEQVRGYYLGLDARYCYYTKEQVSEFNYINYFDHNIIGYSKYAIKNNEYLIEILQKYKSTYLFSQLLNDTNTSTKLLDLFNMRDTGLSNKQLVRIIKYFSKHKNLDISIYKDYLDDLRELNYKLNWNNLLNKDYRSKHQELSMKRNIIANKRKNELLSKAYEGIEDVNVDGLYIIHPKNVEDLKEEGKQLHHCVGSYANRIIKGDSIVYFLRQDPDKPMLTAEVSNGKILQLRGENNSFSNVTENIKNKANAILNDYINQRKEQVHA